MHHPNDPFVSGEGIFGMFPETRKYLSLAREYVAALDNVRTAPAIRKLIRHMKLLQFLSVEDRALVPFKLQVLMVQLPDPDSLQHCYNLVHYHAVHRPSETSLLPNFEHLGCNMFEEPPSGFAARGADLGHCVAFTLIKIKLYVDLKSFLAKLDAVLVQRDGKWNNSVILANVLPFMWPSQHYFSPSHVCVAAGKARASVGALRALQRRLRGQIRAMLPRVAQFCKSDIWRTLVSIPHWEIRARVMEATARYVRSNQDFSQALAAEADVVVCDFMPILNGYPYPTLPGVLEVLKKHVAGQTY
jgi:hypothetical protein